MTKEEFIAAASLLVAERKMKEYVFLRRDNLALYRSLTGAEKVAIRHTPSV